MQTVVAGTKVFMRCPVEVQRGQIILSVWLHSRSKVTTTLCSEKKHPLTLTVSFISQWIMCRF